MPGGGSVRVSPAPASSQTEPGQHRHQPPPASSLLSVLSEFLLLSVASPAQPSPATSQCAKIVGAWCGRSQQPAQVFVEYLTRMCGASSGRPARTGGYPAGILLRLGQEFVSINLPVTWKQGKVCLMRTLYLNIVKVSFKEGHEFL